MLWATALGLCSATETAALVVCHAAPADGLGAALRCGARFSTFQPVIETYPILHLPLTSLVVKSLTVRLVVQAVMIKAAVA